MENIRTEQAQVPLKAAINKRIIMGITIFFVITLSAMLIFIFASMKWSAPGVKTSLPVSLNFRMPNISSNTAKMVAEGFVFFDVILALYLLDAYLRKKITAKQA
jgi:magnesium-transporting ATPase (P-type)